MHTPNDLNQSRIVLKQDSTLIAVIARQSVVVGLDVNSHSQ